MNKDPWVCLKCDQMNSGWTTRCGRCYEPKDKRTSDPECFWPDRVCPTPRACRVAGRCEARAKGLIDDEVSVLADIPLTNTTRFHKMRYEINISRHGYHYFATAERSLRSRAEAWLVYCDLSSKFPKPEYKVSVSLICSSQSDVTSDFERGFSE